MTHAFPSSTLRRRLLAGLANAAAAFGLAAAALPAAAQTYPDKTIKILVLAGVGTVTDMIARLLAVHMGKAMGQAMVVENIPAAGGVPGTLQLVRAAKDGYTIALLSNNHVVNPSIYKDMPYDAMKDIQPISFIASTPMVLVANPALPAKNTKELLALARSKPGVLTYGSAGNGTILHLAGVLFTSEGKVNIRHIPYKGVAPAITDVMSGQIDTAFLGVASVQQLIDSGKLRAIGVTTPYRSAMLPNVPTFAEEGLTNYSLDGWISMAGPAGLPRPIVDKLNAELKAALALKEVQDAMAKLDLRVAPNTPEQVTQFFQTELEKHTTLAKKGMATLD